MKSRSLKSKKRRTTKKQIMNGSGMFDFFFGKKKEPQNVQNEEEITTPDFGTKINNIQKQESQPQQYTPVLDEEDVNTDEYERQINTNLPKKEIQPSSANVKQEPEGDPGYAGMIDEQKQIIRFLYKKLIKIKLNSWANTFYYKSVKKCKPDFSKLLHFLNLFINKKFDCSYCNKMLDSINTIAINKYCFKLNKKIPSLLNDLKQAITTYMESIDINLNDTDTITSSPINTPPDIKELEKKYNIMEQQLSEIEQKKMDDTKRQEEQMKVFFAPKKSVNLEKMWVRQYQKQNKNRFNSYLSTDKTLNSTPRKPSLPLSEGGKTRKRSKNKKIRNNRTKNKNKK